MADPGPTPGEAGERGATSTQERSVAPVDSRDERPHTPRGPELREVLRRVQERLDEVLLERAERRAENEDRASVVAGPETTAPAETAGGASEDPAQPSPFSSYELEVELERPPRDTAVRARERLTARRRTAVRPRPEPTGARWAGVKRRLGRLLNWLLVGALIAALSAVAALLIG